METQIIQSVPSRMKTELAGILLRQKEDSGNLLMLAGALHDAIEIIQNPADAIRLNEILSRMEKILKRKFL